MCGSCAKASEKDIGPICCLWYKWSGLRCSFPTRATDPDFAQAFRRSGAVRGGIFGRFAAMLPLTVWKSAATFRYMSRNKPALFGNTVLPVFFRKAWCGLKRERRVVALFTIMMCGLMAGLGGVATASFHGEELAQAAARQSSYELTVTRSRGDFYDCTGQKLTSRGQKTLAGCGPHH